jgi:hypothetical protein
MHRARGENSIPRSKEFVADPGRGLRIYKKKIRYNRQQQKLYFFLKKKTRQMLEKKKMRWHGPGEAAAPEARRPLAGDSAEAEAPEGDLRGAFRAEARVEMRAIFN